MLDVEYVLSNAARRRGFALALAILLISPRAAEAAPKLRLSWDGLAIVAGKTVSITMPGGAVITGKAIGLEMDALLVDVKKTTGSHAYPKGPVHVPRATLRVLEVRSAGAAGRTVGTILGAIGGGVLAVVAVAGMHGSKVRGQVFAGGPGILAAGISGGYLVGKVIDDRATIIEIVP